MTRTKLPYAVEASRAFDADAAEMPRFVCPQCLHEHVQFLPPDDCKACGAPMPLQGPAPNDVVHYHCNKCDHDWRAHSKIRACPDCGSKDLKRLEAMSAVESGRRHLSGKPKANGKPELWPNGLNALGHPTWLCPSCFEQHECSVCPSACRKCGTAGDPKQGPPHKPNEYGLFTLEQLEERRKGETKPPKPETKGPKRETNPAAGETRAPAQNLQGLVRIELAKILPSPDNPRKSFPKDQLDELVASIEQTGLQEPLTVLPCDAKGNYELLDGERRLKALQILAKKDKARWGETQAQVRAMSRDAARAYRLSTFVRAGLNPIEEALALQAACAGGLTQEAAGKLAGMTQGAVANKIRLLKAPEPIQQRIISGEMSEREVRDELLPLLALPGDILKIVCHDKKNRKAHVGEIRWQCQQTAEKISRPMHDNSWYGEHRKFKMTPAIEKELDLRDVGGEKRAFNAARWDELQAEARKKSTERKDAADAKETPAQAKAKAKQRQEQFDRRLYLWKVRWLQARCAERLAADHMTEGPLLKLLLHFGLAGHGGDRETDIAEVIEAVCKTKSSWHGVDDYESLSVVGHEKLWDVIGKTLAKWIMQDPDRWSSEFRADDVEALAKELKVDIRKEWMLDESFLELHSKDQLLSLMDEWALPRPLGNDKRSEVIAKILGYKPKRCPAELVELKHVQLRMQ